MSVFQLPAQIRTVAQSYFCLVDATSFVTASDLDVLSNLKGIGCLICKINFLMEILAMPPILIMKNHPKRNGISGAIPTSKGDAIYFAESRNVAPVRLSSAFCWMGDFVPHGENSIISIRVFVPQLFLARRANRPPARHTADKSRRCCNPLALIIPMPLPKGMDLPGKGVIYPPSY
jgi:hypothetical protein